MRRFGLHKYKQYPVRRGVLGGGDGSEKAIFKQL